MQNKKDLITKEKNEEIIIQIKRSKIIIIQQSQEKNCSPEFVTIIQSCTSKSQKNLSNYAVFIEV